MPSLQEKKANLRAEMRSKRAAGTQSDPFIFKKLRDVFTAHFQLAAAAVIGSYCAFRGEMDPLFLTDALREAGHKIALPVIVGKNMPLVFRLHEKGDEVAPNAMGIAEPLPSAPPVEPDVVLVPLLAFDRQRNRLGYGGGFYDRTIGELRARKSIVAIGVAYGFQEIAEVPTGPNDIPLDKILTEIKVI